MSNTKITKLKAEVSKMESVYSKSSTSDKTKAILKKAIDKANQEIDKLERKAKAPAKEPKAAAAPKKAKAAAKKPASALDKLKGMIKRKKYSAYKDKGVDLKKDADRPALPLGKRKSKSGNTYYEYRANRFDVKQPPKRYPKLEDGGMMARGGKLEIGDMVMVDDSGYVKLFSGFDISKPAKIISKGKTKSSGKVVYFYGLEMADGRKPFNNAPEYKLTKVSEDGGMMADGGRVFVGKFNEEQLRNKEDKIAIEKKMKETGLKYVDSKIIMKNGKPHMMEVYLYADGGMMVSGGEVILEEDYYGKSARVPYGGEMFLVEWQGDRPTKDSVIISDYGFRVVSKEDPLFQQIHLTLLKAMKENKVRVVEKGGYMAKGGALQHGLKEGDTILYINDNILAVKNEDTNELVLIDIEKGERENAPHIKDSIGLMRYAKRNKMASGGMMAKGGRVDDFSDKIQEGDIVWDSNNKRYGVVLNTYDYKYGEIRLDSDGNQPIEDLYKLGSEGDKGTKEKLKEALLAHKRLMTEYPDRYDKVNYAKGGYMYEGGGSLDIDSFADGGELKKNYLVTFDSQRDEYAPTTFQSTSVYDLMETLKATIPAEVEILSIEEMTPSMEMKYGGVAGY